MASAGVQAYIGVWGRAPSRVQGGRASGVGSGIDVINVKKIIINVNKRVY